MSGRGCSGGRGAGRCTCDTIGWEIAGGRTGTTCGTGRFGGTCAAGTGCALGVGAAGARAFGAGVVGAGPMTCAWRCGGKAARLIGWIVLTATGG
jgi:hypothetical protein